jgi:hypothetical protein
MNPAARPTITLDQPILNLWKSGLDTYDISKRLHLPEHVIARRLWALRNAERAE